MKNLTTKQKKYIANRLDGQSGTTAVLNAGYNTTPLNARIIASQNNKKPEIKAEIEANLAELNITPKLLLSRLREQIIAGENETATLNTIKYLFDLMGWDKDIATKESQKIIVNIDRSVIPMNLTADKSPLNIDQNATK